MRTFTDNSPYRERLPIDKVSWRSVSLPLGWYRGCSLPRHAGQTLKRQNYLKSSSIPCSAPCINVLLK